jgi:hypothetical protein
VFSIEKLTGKTRGKSSRGFRPVFFLFSKPRRSEISYWNGWYLITNRAKRTVEFFERHTMQRIDRRTGRRSARPTSSQRRRSRACAPSAGTRRFRVMTPYEEWRFLGLSRTPGHPRLWLWCEHHHPTKSECQLSAFIDDCCELVTGKYKRFTRTSQSDLFAQYRLWCKENGERIRLTSSIVFGRVMQESSFRRIISEGRAVFTGIELRGPDRIVNQQKGRINAPRTR